MKRLLCAILASAMLLTLCACGGTGKKGTYNDAGYYAIFSVDEGDETFTQSDFESMDWNIFLQLNDDGTGVLDMDNGDVTELTWKDGSINDGTGDLPYVLAGGMLTLDLSDSDGTFVMIFKKGAAPADVTEETGEATAVSSFADRFSRTGNPESPAAEDAEEESAPGPENAEEENAPGPEDVEEKPASSGTGSFVPVSGDIEDFHVEILGAEAFEDSDGNPAVRFYYDFTNNSEDPIAPFWDLNYAAEEDGYKLVTAYADYSENIPEYNNDYLTVFPGITIRCIDQYAFRPDGEELTFTISSYYGDSLTATFNPQDLPGRPGEWSPELNPDLQFYAGYSDDGSSDDAHVYIDRAENASESSWNGGGRLIRVYFEYTNTGDEEAHLTSACTVRAYQDGIELDTSYADDELESDDAYYDDVKPGEKVTVSQCWRLRSDSPIEIAVTDWWTDEVICACLFE